MKVDKTVVCVASGPSLTKQDCDYVCDRGKFVIAVNNSWELLKNCNVVYASDFSWWRVNYGKVPKELQRWTCAQSVAKRYKINYHSPFHKGGHNSGGRAIEFAISKGAKRIFLLGYDCSVKKGIHWHGPHKNKLLSNPSPQRCKQWERQFHQVAGLATIKKVLIINCSRFTALTIFERAKLEDVL